MSSSEESRVLASRIVAQSAVQFKIMEILKDMTVNPPSVKAATAVQERSDPTTSQSPISVRRRAE